MSTPSDNSDNKDNKDNKPEVENALPWIFIFFIASLPYALLIGLLLNKAGHTSTTVAVTVPIILVILGFLINVRA
jgi:hypothetical protein